MRISDWSSDVCSSDEAGQFGPSITGIYGQTVTFPLGSLISAVISFLAVAAVVYFVFVYPMNRIKERASARAGVTATDQEPRLPTEQELLVQIRDLLEKRSAEHTSELQSLMR